MRMIRQTTSVSGLTFRHGLNNIPVDLAVCHSAAQPKHRANVELVSECQTSYIEDTNLPTDNEGEEVGQGDIVQTECH